MSFYTYEQLLSLLNEVEFHFLFFFWARYRPDVFPMYLIRHFKCYNHALTAKTYKYMVFTYR